MSRMMLVVQEVAVVLEVVLENDFVGQIRQQTQVDPVPQVSI